MTIMILPRWPQQAVDLFVLALMFSLVINKAAKAVESTFMANATKGGNFSHRRGGLAGAREQCTDALQVAMSRMSDFYKVCLPANVIDVVKVCENCGEPYRLAVDAFADLQKTLHCLNEDTVIHAAFRTFIGFWGETGCNNCYLTPITMENHSSPPQLRSDVQLFMGNLSQVDVCIGAHPGDTACTQCRQPYATVVEMYKKLLSISAKSAKEDADAVTALKMTFGKYFEVLGSFSVDDDEPVLQQPRAPGSGSHLCVDVVQAMNKTRSTWVARGCEPQRSIFSLVGPIIVVTSMLVLPIIFYMLIFYINVRSRPSVEVQQKRLRWRYNTFSEDYIDDKSHEVASR